MMNMDPIRLIIGFCVLLYSVIFHEISHGVSALALGDHTAKVEGRLSLNPLRHIDLFNTIILPILCLMTMGFAFGGAKPVRINPLNFRNPSLGFALSSLAGPICNVFLAVVGFALLFFIHYIAPDFVQPGSYNIFFFYSLIFTNLILAVFNLIPIPPLDGSRVLRHFLPSPLKSVMDSLEPFGLFILILLIWTGGLDKIIMPFLNILEKLIIRPYG